MKKETDDAEIEALIHDLTDVLVGLIDEAAGDDHDAVWAMLSDAYIAAHHGDARRPQLRCVTELDEALAIPVDVSRALSAWRPPDD